MNWIYRELIYNQRREIPFWMLLGFIPTFLIARLLVHADPNIFLRVHHTHVHHFTYGIFLLAITGFLSLVYPGRWRMGLGAIYGVGLALAADEFGMWLRLTNEYGNRLSYDAIIIIGAFLAVVVYGVELARAFYRRIKRRRFPWLRLKKHR